MRYSIEFASVGDATQSTRRAEDSVLRRTSELSMEVRMGYASALMELHGGPTTAELMQGVDTP
jgi:hypothetical protein